MPGRIRPEDIEAVRERTDIVQVVSAYLQLKKAGRDSLVGLCPFHTEKTPSFSVSPAKQLYHCHGCDEGGTVFTFLQKLENLSFPEAVERLAVAAGITLRYEGQTSADRKSAGHRQALHRAIGEAAGLYNRLLTEGREGADAREYLASRGIGPEAIERFGVGYSPGYPDYLLKRLSRSYSPELLVEAGLVSKDDQGNLRDRFRGRVMFPIHDLSGSAVGFGGRLLAGAYAPPNAAKYVNSPETPVYRKGSLLYNLHRAKAEIARTGRAFLVEGYTDVIALDRAGIGGAVATCGTALGEDHIRLLARFAQSVILAFDSDEAGARAAERAFPFFEQYPVELAVLILPEGLDPADFVLSRAERAEEELAELGERATPLLEYMVDRHLVGKDLSTPEGQTRAVRTVVEQVLVRIKDPVLQEKYAVITADKVGRTTVSETAVLLELQRLRGGVSSSGREEDRAARRLPPWQKVEREALKLLIQAPELCGRRAADLGPDRFATPGYRAAFELIRDASGRALSPSALVAMAQDRARGEQLGKLLAAVAVEPPETLGEVADNYVDQVFLRLEEFSLKRQSDEIKKQLQRLNPLKASKEYGELYERFVKLEGARRRIRVESEAVGSAP